MKKLFALILAMAMVLTLLTGCASTASPEKADSTPAETANGTDEFVVGFSVASLDYPYYVTMQEALEAACEAKGWKSICVDSGNDAEKALNDCNDMILKGVNALVISSWFGETLNEVFDKCAEKGIPVFLIDTGTVNRDANYVTEIGTDSYQAGYYGGYWTAKYMQEDEGKTEVNLINFYNQTEMSSLRVEGFVAGLKEGGLTVNVLNEYLADTREGYMANCEDALITYDNIDLIYGASALAGLGAFDACEAANRTEIKIVGFDAEQEEKDKIDAGTNYIASVMQLPASMAEETIEMIDGYVNEGKTYDKQVASASGVYCTEGALISTDIVG